MSRGQQLAKNTVILFIGQFSTQFISFLLLPLYTAILTTKQYGTVDLINTYVSLLLPIVTLCIEYAAFKYMLDAKGDFEKLSEIISNSLWFTVFTILSFSIVYILISPFIINDYKYFVLINLVSGALVSLMMQFYRGLKDLKTYTIASIVASVTNILLNIIFLLILDLGVRGMLLANFLSNISVIVFLFMRKDFMKYIYYIPINKITVKKYLKYSLPVVPNTLSGWMMNASDRVIVSSLLGLGSNAILAISHKFSSIYTVFFNVFYLSWSEMSISHIKDEDGDRFYSDMFNTSIKIFASACLVIISAIPFIFPLLINKSYDQAYYQIPIFMLAMLVNTGVGMLGTVYVTFDKTKEIAKSTTIAAIINIIVNLSLINKIGLYAASISSFIGYFLVLLLRIKDIRKYIKVYYDKKYYVSLIALLLLLLTAYYRRIFIEQIIMFIIVVAYSVLTNWTIIKQINQKLFAILQSEKFLSKNRHIGK